MMPLDVRRVRAATPAAASRAVLAGVVVTLLAVAVAGSWLPASRAARVDPAIALRAD